LKNAIKDRARSLISPLARVLGSIGVSPNHLTLAGLVASAGAGVLVAYGYLLLAAAALFLGSLCDVLDGAVARATGRSSQFGAFLDSTVDRYAEMVYFAGLLVYFIRIEPSTVYALLAFLSAGGSFMVSYTRARAEGIGLSCDVGFMERPERLILLLVATVVGPMGIRVALWALPVLVTWTSLQRIHHVYRETRSP
jgi:CDP-diacylglycerol--glycerol-3-phosphate 3-phosphatidyltransferase